MGERCKNCGHDGDMHSDGEHHHIGECFIKLISGDFCQCRDFIEKGEDEQWGNFVFQEKAE